MARIEFWVFFDHAEKLIRGAKAFAVIHVIACLEWGMGGRNRLFLIYNSHLCMTYLLCACGSLVRRSTMVKKPLSLYLLFKHLPG